MLNWSAPGTTTSAIDAENSDVLLAESVAVAVTSCPAGTTTGIASVKLATPLGPVVTAMVSRNCCPSAIPDGSALGLAKNWSVYREFAAPVYVPLTSIPLEVDVIAVKVGGLRSM